MRWGAVNHVYKLQGMFPSQRLQGQSLGWGSYLIKDHFRNQCSVKAVFIYRNSEATCYLKTSPPFFFTPGRNLPAHSLSQLCLVKIPISSLRTIDLSWLSIPWVLPSYPQVWSLGLWPHLQNRFTQSGRLGGTQGTLASEEYMDGAAPSESPLADSLPARSHTSPLSQALASERAERSEEGGKALLQRRGTGTQRKGALGALEPTGGRTQNRERPPKLP